MGIAFAFGWTMIMRPFGTELAAKRLTHFSWKDIVTLSERSSHFISAQLGDKGGFQAQTLWQNIPSRKVVTPPRGLGLALMSVGSVLTLKSLSMKNTG